MKNTEEIVGVCVYSGMQTKMFLNSKMTRIKFSTVEKSLNRYLIFFVGLLLFEIFLSTTLSMTLGVEYVDEDVVEE